MLKEIPGEVVPDFTVDGVVVQILEDYDLLSVIIEHEGKLYFDHCVDADGGENTRWLVIEMDFKDWMLTASEYTALVNEIPLNMKLSKALDVGELVKAYLRGIFDANKHGSIRAWIERQTGQFYLRDHEITTRSATLRKIDKKDLPDDYLPVKE